MSLGNKAGPPGMVLNTTGLDSPVSINAADLTATFEAGMTLENVQSVLGQNSQFLALDSALSERATLGGILASGSSGPLKWHYGHPRDLVIGMRVVQPDGTVTKSGGQVVKNVSGYDMARLHVGGLGTLGVIAEVSFKLTPKPDGEKTVIAAFEDTRSCGDAALSVFNSQVMPLALTSCDSNTFQESGGFDMAGDQVLVVRLGGRPRALARQVDDINEFSRRHGASQIEVVDGNEALVLWKGLADAGWTGELQPEVVVKVSVLPNSVQALVDSVNNAATGMKASHVAAPGYGNVMVFWRAETGIDLLEAARASIEATRKAAKRLGGSAIVERCPVELKPDIDVWDDADEAIEIMRRMKREYDPRGILNPGRFIGGI